MQYMKVNENIPIDLDIARTPETRHPPQSITMPPAAMILAYSSSRRIISTNVGKWFIQKLNSTLGHHTTLWSTDKAIASLPRQRTALESPQLATIICEVQTMATMAVEPTVSRAMGERPSPPPISSSTLRKHLVKALVHNSSLLSPSFKFVVMISNSSTKAEWIRSLQ